VEFCEYISNYPLGPRMSQRHLAVHLYCYFSGYETVERRCPCPLPTKISYFRAENGTFGVFSGCYLCNWAAFTRKKIVIL